MLRRKFPLAIVVYLLLPSVASVASVQGKRAAQQSLHHEAGVSSDD